jgi:hypothetical protein
MDKSDVSLINAPQRDLRIFILLKITDVVRKKYIDWTVATSLAPPRVAFAPRRDEDHHPLPGPREQHAVGVLQIPLPPGLLHVRPRRPAKTVIAPVVARPAYVGG